MIARGDLAVECGYERLAEVQEEILWLCQAAHVPVVWATQVLDQLAKTGRPSRAEITYAAMGQHAECVMLNKGPRIVEAISVLDDILRRMNRHHHKQRSLLPQPTERRCLPRRCFDVRSEQLGHRVAPSVVGDAGKDIAGDRAHLALRVTSVCCEREFPHRRAHTPRPVSHRHRLHRSGVQYRQVPRKSADTLVAQPAEAFGDGSAHQLQLGPAAGQALRIGAGAVQGRTDTRDEHGVIGQPTRHVRNALHREPATFECLMKPVQPRIVTLLERRWLLRDKHVFRQTVIDRSADAREAQGHRARDVGRQSGASVGVVAEEQCDWMFGKHRQLSAHHGKVIAAQRDQYEIERLSVCSVDDRCRGLGQHVGENVARAEPVPAYLGSPLPVCQDRDGVAGSPEVCAVDGSDDAGTDD